MKDRGFTNGFSIDDMPNLSASLGKSGCDRIRFHCMATGPTTARERLIDNPHREFMQVIPPHAGGPIDDIIAGIAALDVKDKDRLSASRLHVILQSANRISTGLLEGALNVDQRQARRYMAACKLAVFHISRHRGM